MNQKRRDSGLPARVKTPPASGSRVLRFDRGELRPSHRTPEGYLFVDVFLAKPGVLEYEEFDGTRRRELVLPEELHRSDSLGTLGGKAVTVEHPPEDVDPDNEAAYAVGTVDTQIEVVADGRVRVGYLVRRRDGIDYIERDGAREASPGYTVKIQRKEEVDPSDVAKWTAEYGEFDAIQRDRRYNHGAITKMARGGRDIHLRAESAFQVVRTDANEPKEEDTMKHAQMLALLTMLINGGSKRSDAVEMVVGMGAKREDAVAAAAGVEAESFQEKVLARLDAMDEDIKALKKADGENPFKKKEDEDDEEDDDDMPKKDMKKKDAADFGAYYKERKRLDAVADGFNFDPAKTEDMSNEDLRKAIVIAANPKARQDADPSYYAAAFDMIEGTRADSTPDNDGPEIDPYANLIRTDGAVPEGDGAEDQKRNDGAGTATWLENAQKQFAARG